MRISVLKHGFAPQDRQVCKNCGKIEFVLAVGVSGVLKGYVVSADGRPARATVRVVVPGFGDIDQSENDGEGKFEFGGLEEGREYLLVILPKDAAGMGEPNTSPTNSQAHTRPVQLKVRASAHGLRFVLRGLNDEGDEKTE